MKNYDEKIKALGSVAWGLFSLTSFLSIWSGIATHMEWLDGIPLEYRLCFGAVLVLGWLFTFILGWVLLFLKH